MYVFCSRFLGRIVILGICQRMTSFPIPLRLLEVFAPIVTVFILARLLVGHRVEDRVD